MSKVINQEQYENYISNGQRSNTVGGCITKVTDVANFKTYDEFYTNLGLHYDGSAYTTADKMYIMKFTSEDTEVKVVRNLGGTNETERKRIMDIYGLDKNHTFIQKDPFVGNGITKTTSNDCGTIEYIAVDECRINDNAAIYELKRDKSEKLVAIRIKEKWYKVEN